jgi:hypothetical protein
VKIKTAHEAETLIMGYLSDKDKTDTGFTSLIIGNSERKRNMGLVEAGVGTKTLEKVLRTKKLKTSIFSPVPKVNAKTAFRTPIKNAEIV